MNFNFFLVAHVINCIAYNRQNHFRHVQKMLRDNFFNRHHHNFNNVIFRLDKIFLRLNFGILNGFFSLSIGLQNGVLHFVSDCVFAVNAPLLHAFIIARVVALFVSFLPRLFKSFFSLFFGASPHFRKYLITFVLRFLNNQFGLKVGFFQFFVGFLRTFERLRQNFFRLRGGFR